MLRACLITTVCCRCSSHCKYPRPVVYVAHIRMPAFAMYSSCCKTCRFLVIIPSIRPALLRLYIIPAVARCATTIKSGCTVSSHFFAVGLLLPPLCVLAAAMVLKSTGLSSRIFPVLIVDGSSGAFSLSYSIPASPRLCTTSRSGLFVCYHYVWWCCRVCTYSTIVSLRLFIITI